tara:strand:+ start:24771 stop:26153 length:1383 start_codon:yes stop_codon:yes gene_type:complete
MEEISLNLGSPNLNVSSNDSAGTIKINIDDNKPQKSVNFGPGAEMLMNPNKNKATSPRADINLSELNDIGDIDISDKPKVKRPSFTDVTSNIFGKPDNSPGITLKVDEPIPVNPLKSATTNPKVETDDGFKTFNEIPVAPSAPPPSPSLSPEETLREKLKILRKLEDLEKRGIQLTKKYSMESSLAEMKGEYEMIKNEKEKKNSIKFQGKMLMAFVSGLEFLNGRFDPFDLKLDGWSEAVNENIDEYDEVFGELHEKYGGKAKMAPEIKLLFMLGGSAAMLHMTNTMFKSSMPGMDDIMRQNPELMQQFQTAAMNSMNQNNPGFGQFMGGVMGGGGGSGPMPPMGAPPMPPMEMRQNPPQMRRTRARPDVAASRRPQYDDAVDLNDKFSKTPRPEMKGPSDLNDILSGLKTKKINIAQKDTNSVVSVNELNEMKNSVLEKPKKSRRKPKSERNTISLNFN